MRTYLEHQDTRACVVDNRQWLIDESHFHSQLLLR